MAAILGMFFPNFQLFIENLTKILNLTYFVGETFNFYHWRKGIELTSTMAKQVYIILIKSSQ